MLLFEARHGSLLAVIDATSITAIRTAAVSAVATRALAREDAGDLAILGSGVQARTHLEAMRCVRKIRRVRVASRSLANAKAFAERESARGGVPVEAAASVHEAVEGADLICTTTSAREPILRGDWIAPGAHVNAVGVQHPDGARARHGGGRLLPPVHGPARVARERRRRFRDREAGGRHRRPPHRRRDRRGADREGPRPRLARRDHALQVARPRDRRRRLRPPHLREGDEGTGPGRFLAFGGSRHEGD